MIKSQLRVMAEQFMRLGAARWGLRTLIQTAAFCGRFWSFIRIRALMIVPVGTACHWSVEIKYPENIQFHGPVVIGAGTTLGAKGGISLGTNVRISKGVLIETASLDLNAMLPYPHIAKAIVIEDGVWLGAHAIVLGGVTIGANAVIGAGAVVSKDVPPGAIVVGGGVRLIERKETYGV